MNNLEWRNNEYGSERRALYIGPLYVGEIMRPIPEKWREWDHLKDTENPKAVERAAYYAKREAKPWRGWIMSSCDGEEFGWYATEDEARGAVENYVKTALGVP